VTQLQRFYLTERWLKEEPQLEASFQSFLHDFILCLFSCITLLLPEGLGSAIFRVDDLLMFCGGHKLGIIT
jgi:hypothetical protein